MSAAPAISPQAIIRNVYYSPKTGFQSAQRTLSHIRRLHPGSGVSLKDVSEFIKQQEVAQVYKQIPRPKVFRHIVASGIDAQWQADLIDLPKLAKVNNGYRYILTIVDIYSRYAWCIALKNKSGKQVAQAFKDLASKPPPHGRSPSVLVTDNGKEFLNKHLREVLERDNVYHRTNEAGDHNHMGIIERFNRTIKTILEKYRSATGNKNWVNVIEEIVEGYNNSFHATTKRRPVDVASGLQDPEQREQVTFKPLDIGTSVRTLINRKQFDKGYEARWTKKIHVISGRKGNRYYVDDSEERSFKESELLVVEGGVAQRAPQGVREVESLRDTFLQPSAAKRVPKKKVRGP